MTEPSGSGPIADEAARLLAALQGWARTFGATPQGEQGEPGAGAEPGHAATCRVCPVCQLIALVRDARPEAVDHLGDAVESLALAVHDLLEGYVGAGRSGRRPDRFEHIDIGGP